MDRFMVFLFALSAFVFVDSQQPLDDLSEIAPYLPSSDNEMKKLLQQCESFSRNLKEENDRLKNSLDVLKMKLEALEQTEEEDDENEDDVSENKKDGSNESDESSRKLRRRRRRGARCDGGSLSAWACAPQCVFKLKGLCGLSLKSICHC